MSHSTATDGDPPPGRSPLLAVGNAPRSYVCRLCCYRPRARPLLSSAGAEIPSNNILAECVETIAEPWTRVGSRACTRQAHFGKVSVPAERSVVPRRNLPRGGKNCLFRDYFPSSMEPPCGPYRPYESRTFLEKPPGNRLNGWGEARPVRSAVRNLQHLHRICGTWRNYRCLS